MTEVHLKFYTLVFIYVVFLEGAAWTAERSLQNSNQKPERCFAITLKDCNYNMCEEQLKKVNLEATKRAGQGSVMSQRGSEIT